MSRSVAFRRATLAWRLVAALAAPGVALGAQAPSSPARGARPTGTPPLVTVRGTVVDPAGRPVDSAALRVRRGSARGASDAAGRFVLERVAATRVELEVTRRGYVPLVLDLVVPRDGGSEVQVILFPVDEGGAAATVPRAADSVTRGDVTAPLAPAPAPPVPAADGGASRPPAAPAPPADTIPPDDAVGRIEARRVAGRGLLGVVTDLRGRPLAGAQVTLVVDRRDVVTDALGRFAFPGAPGGAALLRVRRVGHAPRTVPLTLAADSATEVAIALETTAQRLARVEVRADAGRLRTFEERRARGFGQFATREQFLLRGPVRPTDALTGFAGVVVLPDGSGRRQVFGRGRCRMPLFIDGVFTPVDAGLSIDDVLSINDIEAIEVHTTSGGLPPELALRSENCGAVVMWTRGARRDR